MRLLVLLVLALLPTLALAGEPTPAALRRAFENNRDSVVRVKGPRRAGAGVMVGSDGHVLTSVEYVGLETAEVEVAGTTYPGQVLLADAYQGIALVKISAPADASFRAAPVRLRDQVRRGQTVVAIRMGSKGPVPVVVPVKRQLPEPQAGFELVRPMRAGTPVFDAGGKLLGVVVKGRRVVPVSAVKQKLAANAG